MPKCPYCKQDVDFSNIETTRKGFGFLKQEIIYSCPYCKSILGISRGKWSS